MGQCPTSWLGVCWVESGLMGLHSSKWCDHSLFWDCITQVHHIIINSQHFLLHRPLSCQVPNSSSRLQCGVELMSSGAKNAPYAFDFKSVLKAHKVRPVHYSLVKLKKTRSGLADAVTYLTLILFLLEVLVELKNRLELINHFISPGIISLSLASWWWGLWTGKEAQREDFQSHNSDWESNVQEVE